MNSPFLQARPRRLLRSLPFLIPPLAWIFIVWLQPPDHMGAFPDRAPWLGKLIYDDWDWSAVVLRGLNASLGRKAGLVAEPRKDDFAAALDAPQQELAERYFVEYPLAATWFFRLPYLFQSVHAPSAVCDGHYGNLLSHRPRNEAERALWHTFRRIMQEYAAGMVVCLLLLMVLVRRGYEPGGGLSGPVWLLVLPGALYFTLNRFDVLPAVLTALSFACLGRRWFIASAAFLALGTLVKVYPLLLAPLIFRYLAHERRAAIWWTMTYGFVATVLFLLPLWTMDWQSVIGPYQTQLQRPPMGPTIYEGLLPWRLAANDALGRGFRFGTLALALLALARTRPPDLAGVLRRGALAVILFANLSVFYSPQWILWFAPMLVPLAGRQRPILYLTAALDIVTYLTFPFAMVYLESAIFLGVMVAARFAILGALAAVLLWPEMRGRMQEKRTDVPTPASSNPCLAS